MGSPAAARRVRLVRGLSRRRGRGTGDRVGEARARSLDDGAHRRAPRPRVRDGTGRVLSGQRRLRNPVHPALGDEVPARPSPHHGGRAEQHARELSARRRPHEGVARPPTQIYETTLMLLAFAWLWRLRDHRHGTGWRFGVYLVLAGAERFLVETVRAKDDRLLG